MIRSLATKCLLICVGLGLLLAAQSCTFVLTDHGHGHTGPPEHAPAHGYRARHTYLYYPSSYVYFDTTRRMYFYLTGGTWRMSVSLPSSITISVGEAVSIELDTDRPYRYFNTHKKKYPPGQLKKKRTPPGHMKKERPPRKYKQPAKRTKRQPSNVHRAKQKQKKKDSSVHRAKYKQPPRQKKKDSNVHRAKYKQQPGQKKKETGKEKETGKGKGKDKGRSKGEEE